MKKQEELFEDVLEELDEAYEKEDEKTVEKIRKRLYKSIGHVDFMEKGEVYFRKNKKGKDVPCSDVLEENRKTTYEVYLGNGCTYSCERQVDSEIMSMLVQVNERLKRVQKRLNMQEVKIENGKIVSRKNIFK